MQPTAQVIDRNREAIGERGRTLFVELADPSLLAGWRGERLVWVDHRGDFNHLPAGVQELGGALLAEALDGPVDRVVMQVPKSRPRTDFILAQLAGVLPPGTPLWLVGQRRAGIEGGARRLEARSSTAEKVDSARHCQLWRGELTPQAFDPEAWVESFEMTAGGQPELLLATLPGVFSLGKLDGGTRLLLDQLAAQPLSVGQGARVLDFAAGAGPLGLFLKQCLPEAAVTLSDVSAVALFCAWMNAQVNGLEAACVQSDGFDELEGDWDAIVSNPPFHTGVETDYRIAERFITEAARRLTPGGELRLVANRHLPYADWIASAFGHCERLKEDGQFVIYGARKGR